MAVIFRDFLQRLTGGVYGPQDSFNLYYWSDQYPSPKKVDFINLGINSEAMCSTRSSDKAVLYFDRDYMKEFEVCSLRKSLIDPKSILMKIRRRGSWQ